MFLTRLDFLAIRDTRTDRHLWAETYERDLGDVLALQGEIARSIATEIQAKLTPEIRARLAGNRAVNTNAYDAYLKGRYFFEQEDWARTQQSRRAVPAVFENRPPLCGSPRGVG